MLQQRSFTIIVLLLIRTKACWLAFTESRKRCQHFICVRLKIVVVRTENRTKYLSAQLTETTSELKTSPKMLGVLRFTVFFSLFSCIFLAIIVHNSLEFTKVASRCFNNFHLPCDLSPAVSECFPPFHIHLKISVTATCDLSVRFRTSQHLTPSLHLFLDFFSCQWEHFAK